MKVELEQEDTIKLRRVKGRLFRIIKDKNQVCVKMIHDYRFFSQKLLEEIENEG